MNAASRRIDKVRECVRKIVRDNWKKEFCLTHRIGLYSVGQSIIGEQRPIVNTAQNEEIILEKFEEIETSQRNSIKPLDALEDLIEWICKMKGNGIHIKGVLQLKNQLI